MGAHLHGVFKLANRVAIEDEIERLIALLDAADASGEDIEPEEDFGIEDQTEGVGDHGRGLLPDRPLYPVDQCVEPLNYLAASREHQAREMGLARSDTGGWRQLH